MALALSVSCNDPESPIKEDDDGIDWPDMTSRDDVLETLVLTHNNPKNPESTSTYRALLHSQYFFALSPWDVPYFDSPIITKMEDIASAEWIFTNEKILELDINPMINEWYEYPELDGETCVNCWACQPTYFIMAQFSDEEMIHMSPPDGVEMSIVVAPDESDSSKWVIRAIYDLYNTR